jgi:hypothetical protein
VTSWMVSTYSVVTDMALGLAPKQAFLEVAYELSAGNQAFVAKL